MSDDVRRVLVEVQYLDDQRDEIELLEKRNNALLQALKRIGMSEGMQALQMKRIARRAMSEEVKGE